ncbi:DUF2380 domain-containing protein [Fulvimarina sp. MAC8]|uniref:DUF2380 domain-containing protein n=1 Tax=Fulvimarina sp. MAC8 TaxID=3162874 RepID=UPI0032ED3CF4
MAEPATVSVIGFDYSDTSGEPRDQTAEHAKRVRDFSVKLAETIGADANLDIVSLPCSQAAKMCTRGSIDADAPLSEARDAGADYLVFGGIQKMSTLVGWGRVDVLDVEADRLIVDRVLSFRGDNDAAFEQAARFAAKDIVRTLSGDPEEINEAAGRKLR